MGFAIMKGPGRKLEFVNYPTVAYRGDMFDVKLRVVNATGQVDEEVSGEFALVSFKSDANDYVTFYDSAIMVAGEAVVRALIIGGSGSDSLAFFAAMDGCVSARGENIAVASPTELSGNAYRVPSGGDWPGADTEENIDNVVAASLSAGWGGAFANILQPRTGAIIQGGAQLYSIERSKFAAQSPVGATKVFVTGVISGDLSGLTSSGGFHSITVPSGNLIVCGGTTDPASGAALDDMTVLGSFSVPTSWQQPDDQGSYVYNQYKSGSSVSSDVVYYSIDVSALFLPNPGAWVYLGFYFDNVVQRVLSLECTSGSTGTPVSSNFVGNPGGGVFYY